MLTELCVHSSGRLTVARCIVRRLLPTMTPLVEMKHSARLCLAARAFVLHAMPDVVCLQHTVRRQSDTNPPCNSE